MPTLLKFRPLAYACVASALLGVGFSYALVHQDFGAVNPLGHPRAKTEVIQASLDAADHPMEEPKRTSVIPGNKQMRAADRFAMPQVDAESLKPAQPVREIVGLGDSVLSGDACDCEDFVKVSGQKMAAGQKEPIQVTNWGLGGQNSAELLQSLDNADVAASVANADIVMITIGANDFDSTPIGENSCTAGVNQCFSGTLSSLEATLSQIAQKVASVRGDRPGTIVYTGYWNVFEDGSVALRSGDSYLTQGLELTGWANGVIARVAHQNGGVFVDLDTPFHRVSDVSALLEEDGDHPNALGHRVIANAVVEAIRHDRG